MDSKQFVNWLRGFMDGKGYDYSSSDIRKIKKELENVKDFDFPTPQILPYSPPYNPSNPIGYPTYPSPFWYTTNTNNIISKKDMLNEENENIKHHNED